MDYSKIIKSVIWYNGLVDGILNWVKQPVENGCIMCPKFYGLYYDKYDIEWQAQLQLLWMMAVLKFGDYGTSPRYGWITDVEGFKFWCEDIIKTIEKWNGQ